MDASAALWDVSSILAQWASGWIKPPPCSVSEWAAENRVMASIGSSEVGPWRNTRVPYMVEIMDCLSDSSPVREVDLMKSTQVAGTECALNWVGYVMDRYPAPMMWVAPTVDLAKRTSTTRLQPMIDACPVLKGKVGSEQKRDAGKGNLLKQFPGGMLVLSGANSAASLASTPVKYLILDEIDKYPELLDDQGSAAGQAERRTSTFARRKIYRNSSPKIKDHSSIENNWAKGDQRYYMVPCPHCGTFQRLEIEGLTDDGQYICGAGPAAQASGGGCGALIQEHAKTDMLARGYWQPTNPTADRRHRSYHIWAAYSPIDLGYTWQEIADLRAEAEVDHAKRVEFVQTILGLPYEGISQRLEWKELQSRAERWVRRTIPRGALLLTCFVDVQHNRFAVMICGWGRRDQCWIIDWVEIPGDPTRPEDWRAVYEFAAQPIVNSCGIPMRPVCIGIDTGNWTQDAYRFARAFQPTVVACKGAKDKTAPTIQRASRVDVTVGGKTYKAGVQLWSIGTQVAKTAVFQRIRGDSEADPTMVRYHFPGDLPEECYQQLTVERYDEEAGLWICPKGKRNEATDCLVGNYAMACRAPWRVDAMRETEWAALEAKLEPPSLDLFAALPERPEIQAAPSAPLAAALQQHMATAPETPAIATPAAPPPPAEPEHDDEFEHPHSAAPRRGWKNGR